MGLAHWAYGEASRVGINPPSAFHTFLQGRQLVATTLAGYVGCVVVGAGAIMHAVWCLWLDGLTL